MLHIELEVVKKGVKQCLSVCLPRGHKLLICGSLMFAGVAQLVEHQPSKLNVASSSLVARFD